MFNLTQFSNKHFIIRTLFVTAVLLLHQVAVAQTTQDFDSSLKATLAIGSDTARLGQLLRLDKNNVSPRQSIKLFNAVLAEAQTLKIDSTVLQAHMQIGRNNAVINNYTEALKNFLAALAIAEKNKDYYHQAMAFDEIGWIYKSTGEINHSAADLDKAAEYINKGLVIAKQRQLQQAEISLMSDLAVIYDLQKLHGKAIETYKAAIAKLPPGSEYRLSTLRMNLGISYKNNGQLDSALVQYKSTIDIVNKTGDDFTKAYITNNVALLYYAMGQYDLSESTAVDAINQSFKQDISAIRIDMYDCLKKIYEKRGNYQQALAFAEKLSMVKDSAFNKDKSAQLKDMQEKYETDLKDKQITSQQEQIIFNKKLNLVLGAGALALLLIAAFVYINMRKTARLNRTISLQRDELAKQSNTLSVMMKELHHRVKNNLQIVSSLLNLQSLRLSDEEAVNAVKESRERVQAMSLIHQRLYKTDDITGINMHEYVKDLADFLAASYGYDPGDITINLDIAEKTVDVDKALPIGLILNELLTNAFKYAFNGIANPRLDIIFKTIDSNITFAVKDNGKGIDPAKWANKSLTGSFGRQLIKALCGQLRAKEHVEIANGTIFTFTIPQAA